MRVSIETLTSDILQRIAFYTIASQETFLGPPSDLFSLAIVSRDIYNKIYKQNPSHLLARVFCFKFNVAAIVRRLSLRWHTTRCLASELIKRFRALKRIKARQFKLEDVWTCYLMWVVLWKKNYPFQHSTFNTLQAVWKRREKRKTAYRLRWSSCISPDCNYISISTSQSRF